MGADRRLPVWPVLRQLAGADRLGLGKRGWSRPALAAAGAAEQIEQ